MSNIINAIIWVILKKLLKKRVKFIIIIIKVTYREIPMKKETVYKIFSKMPTLETERLILRPMRLDDAEDMYDYARREDVTRYLTWLPHGSITYTKDYLSYIEARYAMGDFFDFAVVEKESGRMIGTCGFTKIDTPNDSAEIGYVLNPKHHGKGYATEAAGEIVRFGFTALKLHRIEAKFMEGNTASLHVMEKLGMTLEGYNREAMMIKGKYRTVGRCGMLYSDYRIKSER